MRLTREQVEIVRDEAREAFGNRVRIWLFGSRVDDEARGGDIDLYVEPDEEDAARIVEAKLRFLVALHRRLGDQRVDVVVRRKGGRVRLVVYDEARAKGIRLV